MPPVGNTPPAIINSTTPSHHGGIDQNTNATPVLARSNGPLRYHAVFAPSHNPSAAASTAAVPDNNNVGPSRSPMIAPAGALNAYELPKSPCSNPTR
ncbi:hypothetical protein KIPE111705_26525 [Kibdelosporangium persicum]